jgi:hypothetical protein
VQKQRGVPRRIPKELSYSSGENKKENFVGCF